MTDKLVNNLVELTSVDTAADKIPIQDASDATELKYVLPSTLIPDASTTVKGKVELATTAETETGTDATRAVTPDGLHDMTTLSGAGWFLDEDAMTSDSAVKVPSQQSVKAYGDRALNTTLNILPLYAHQGFLINGKISVTDTGSGLTAAIKTLAGTDPSATDPVYCRIGDTVRTISAALSVTKADGTNWCNAGSAELATKEIDYFVYLGYNSTDGVVIGFSRFPGARQYSDFSTTSTNEKYCAISTITNAASTDYYTIIGRFAATLSAGAGYTWSVPTFSAANLVQEPIYDTRWLDAACSYTGFSSAPTSSLKYKVDRNMAFIKRVDAAGGASNATGFTFTIPFSCKVAATSFWSCHVQDNSANQTTPGHLESSAGSNIISVWKSFYRNTFTAAGNKDVFFGVIGYEI